MNQNSLNTIEVNCGSIGSNEALTTPIQINTNFVSVYLIDIPNQISTLANLYGLLNEYEQIKSTKYRLERDSQRYIIAKSHLRLLLSKYLNIEPKAIEYEYNDKQKPFLKGAKNLNFNVSHSGEKIAIVINSKLVGVDIELVDEEFDFNSVLKNTFSAEENLFVTNSPNIPFDFYKLWTRKEALVKAISKGIDDNFVLIPCLDGKHLVSKEMIGSELNWVVKSIELEKNYIISIAYESVNPLPEIKLFNWTINLNN